MAAIETAELAKAAAVALAIYGRSLLEGRAPAVPADAPISVGDAPRLWHALQPVFKDHPELIVVFQVDRDRILGMEQNLIVLSKR